MPWRMRAYGCTSVYACADNNKHSAGPHSTASNVQGDPELALRVLREKQPRTGHAPNAWHHGAVFLAFLKAGNEAGALAIQSEWRSLQSRDAAEQLGSVADGVVEGVGEGFGDGLGDRFGGRASARVGDRVADSASNDSRNGVGDTSDGSRAGQLLRGVTICLLYTSPSPRD